MELFPLETLMEEMKPTFRDKYVFDSEGKSLIVSTLGIFRLPAVWYQDQNGEFQSHNLLQNCGQFQPGAEGKIWWLRIQSGIVFNMKLHQMSQPLWEVQEGQRFGWRIKNYDSWKILLVTVQIFSTETLLEEIKPVVTK